MEKILYVEDDLSLIDGLKYTLENSGYSVDNARTVRQAFALFKSNPYHLLLLDITLPDGSEIRVDLIERLVWKNGKLLSLPLVEYKLLCLLMRNPNHLLTRETILDSLWDGAGNYVDDNTLSVYIRRLRNKIEETPNTPQYLLTERGIGYKWIVE